MNTTALMMMAGTMTLVTLITSYFFYRVWKAPMSRGEHTSLPDPADFGEREMGDPLV